jgi:hypothetical protein
MLSGQEGFYSNTLAAASAPPVAARDEALDASMC